MPDLLLELFSEEIPARMQAEAASNLTRLFVEEMENKKLTHDMPKAFVTPRRIAFTVSNIQTMQSDSKIERKGPKINAPKEAIEGFLKSNGLTSVEQLEKRTVGKDEVYFAIALAKGMPTSHLLISIIENILFEFPWPKSMRWGSGEQPWVRPLHSILCIFGGEVVPVEFAGVKAGNVTYGHRFLSPKPITIKKPGEYEEALKKAYVWPNRDGRKSVIRENAVEKASAKNLFIRNDEALLEEVTGLVEWPVLLAGKIDKAFMDLPPEVLVSEMRAHQKYFALVSKDGALADTFLITANMETKDGGKAIIAGNERVLKARLSDGRFFWDQDRKKKLEAWAEGLKAITFHAKLGSIADKVERVQALAQTLAGYVPGADKAKVERAASLCKADLTTGMVGEFPELQGVMGWYYANAQKEAPEVAEAIRDHYKPQGPNDSVPAKPVSICVALADKLDTLVSMFAIGEKPTGSKDPFALRRAALGVIRIILENNIRLPLKTCFAAAPVRAIATAEAKEKLVKQAEAELKQVGAHRVGRYLTVNAVATEDLEAAVSPELSATLYDFFADRLKVQLKDQGIRHDVIAAVMAGGDDDLVRVVARARALQAFLATDDGANLLTAYKRAANILAIEEKKDKETYAAAGLEEAVLAEKEEKDLAEVLKQQTGTIENLLAKEQFVEAMQLLAKARRPVDLFFDKVMVNCEDAALRANRLRLLARLRDAMNRVADFSSIEG